MGVELESQILTCVGSSNKEKRTPSGGFILVTKHCDLIRSK